MYICIIFEYIYECIYDAEFVESRVRTKEGTGVLWVGGGAKGNWWVVIDRVQADSRYIDKLNK